MSRNRPTPARAGRPRDPQLDEAIVRAATELLAERGAAQTSIEQIARRAGVTKVSVYRRWRTKEDLLAHAVEALRDRLPAVDLAAGDDEPLPQVVQRLLPRWGEILADARFRRLTARLLAAAADHPALLEAYRTHHVAPRRERARAVMERAQAEGFFDADADIDTAIDLMEGAVIRYLLLDPRAADPVQTTRYLRTLLTQVGFALPRADDA
ncbi:TetR/AcrR family transcriptional regulator [Thermobifida alba]|jgi:AcrR family transcriptional regulator|uniref:TetR/AcrR family transcriptional regulator n=1 Tax=Thermobifida alba TaxID=53522 RepID=A0ABY4KYQ1_THEAE|nr:TetR/AcrR family transcriptional regulator [Thermobifida alba]UPT20569.1 TetR/AcrR family transcriptional regulator [Thermobifida alba]